MNNGKKLKTLIRENKQYITSGKVCYCYFHTEKCKQVEITNLTIEELNISYKSSEWWIEDGDLCLMKGRRY